MNINDINEAIKHLNEKKEDFESIRKKAEYIEKAELIKKLCLETTVGYCSPTIKTIKEFPAADVQPVKRGTWRKDEQGYDVYVECSECGLNLSLSNYIENEWRETLG